MGLLILTAVILICTNCVHMEGISYNCHRPNMECEGVESECPDDGSPICTCDEELGGHDCGYNQTNVGDGCSQPCENGGTCWKDSEDNYVCYCAEQFYGKRCEHPRVTLYCNPSSMDMQFTPHREHQDFAGVAYIKDHDNDTACTFTASQTGGATSLKLAVDYTECGGAALAKSKDGDTVRTFTVVMQYDRDLQTADDEEFHMRCAFKPSGSLIPLTKGFTQDNENNTRLGGGSIEQQLHPVALEVQDDSGNAITQPQKIGDVIVLVFTLVGGNVYTHFRVEEVTVGNGQTGSQALTVPLITDGCVMKKRKRIVDKFSADTHAEISVSMKVVKLRYSLTLTFTAQVKICMDQAHCNASSCDATNYLTDAKYGAGIGRRKRDVTDAQEGVKFQQLDATIRILDGDQKASGNQNVLLSADCIRSPGAIMIIATLLVLLALTLGSTIYFVVRATRSNKEKEWISYDSSVTSITR